MVSIRKYSCSSVRVRLTLTSVRNDGLPLARLLDGGGGGGRGGGGWGGTGCGRAQIAAKARSLHAGVRHISLEVMLESRSACVYAPPYQRAQRVNTI